MKLSTLSAKLTCMKSNTAKVLAGVVLAGAAFTAAAPAAQAQQWGVAVNVGQPQYYYAPAPRPYYDRDHEYWEARRREEAREHYWQQRRWQEHEEHERWEHARPYGFYGYGR